VLTLALRGKVMTQLAKIKLRVGSIELEYEGDPAFLKEGLESLLVTMTDLAKVAPPEEIVEAAQKDTSANGTTTVLKLSTNSIAAHMDPKSGPDLLLCALAQLELVQGKTECARSDILGEMKKATTYFNENMSKNMSNALDSVTKSKKVNQLGSDKYALSAAERKTFEAKLAQIG
jgi:hypothetical protein